MPEPKKARCKHCLHLEEMRNGEQLQCRKHDKHWGRIHVEARKVGDGFVLIIWTSSVR